MQVTSHERPKICVVVGSQSDWPIVAHAGETLDQLEIAYDQRIVSAHRTPDRLWHFAREAEGKGLQVIIAGAGGAAHLPGMLAALTRLPVLAVPVPTGSLSGWDSLLSIVQMPAGIPVGTFAIGKAGAINAALMAAAILAVNDPIIAQRLDDFRRVQSTTVPERIMDG